MVPMPLSFGRMLARMPPQQRLFCNVSRRTRTSRSWPRAGRTIYEWEQSLEEVNLYIETPPGLRAESIDCKITPKHIRLGVKGNPPFIDVRCWVTAYDRTKNNIPRPPPPFPPLLASLSSVLIPLPSSSRKRQNVLYFFERALLQPTM